jgi:hypothetical protein
MREGKKGGGEKVERKKNEDEKNEICAAICMKSPL